MAVEQICHLLANIKGIVENNLEKYLNRIKKENINGKVLMNCDLAELKQTLDMNFGDWELFKIVLIQLRNIDMDQSNSSPVIGPKLEKGNIKNIKQNNSELEQLVLEKEAVFGLVSSINEDARDDIEMQEEDKEKTSKAAHIYLSVVNDNEALVGGRKSRSIPKLVISEEGDDYHKSYDHHLSTSIKSLRRQRSKSENPPEFDEKDEQDLNRIVNRNRFV